MELSGACMDDFAESWRAFAGWSGLMMESLLGESSGELTASAVGPSGCC